ncbi:MAG: hypothetical protein ACYSWQ_18740 [Planctomycetota bacterium]|jgi:hypothetical protein
MKLSEKDIRALKLGAVSTVLIVLLLAGLRWKEHWGQARIEGQVLKAKLKDIDLSETKRKGLMAIVPAFKMPVGAEEQGFLFRDEFNKQLKDAKIKNDPLVTIPNKRSPLTGYRSLHLSCKASKCQFSQVLDLLARLNENPYLVGIEEFSLKIDPKKRTEVELNITVSTFTKATPRTGRS